MQASPEAIRAALQDITDQRSFIDRLLKDTLEWDIPETAKKVSDLGHAWFLNDDFGMSSEETKNLGGTEIFQVPIVRNRDLLGEDTTTTWGVFFVQFKNEAVLQKGRGLASPLRKILRKIVRNRHTLGQRSDLPLFDRENVLFICADPSYSSVSFVRFKAIKGKGVPPLAAFGWRQNEMNAVRTLCQHNLPFLHWEGDWAQAFDIEKVTKAFYTEIFGWFERAGPKVQLPLADAVRILDRSLADLRAEAVIRLVIRMIFIWFMKEKQGLVPETLFNKREVQAFLRDKIGGDGSKEDGHCYYNAILQNLFFATLNCPQNSRRFMADHPAHDESGAAGDSGVSVLYRFKDDLADPEGLQELLATVPFLNGGLFTCHDNIQKSVSGDKKETYHLDGFSEDSKNRAIVPDDLFFAEDGRSGLIDILKRYHFTIEEHTPLDQEVALDPELLGHVFENLLAAYNPETKKTARKKTGSYYTPRNIVDYMVGESLFHYLTRKMEWASDDANQQELRDLLDYEQEGNPFVKETSNRLKSALYSVRIFDPACGSGAFPMGALQRMNHVLEKLNAAESSYERKLAMISQNIYGADIQPIATEITTQRFFISLLIDQKVDKSQPNSGVEALPNLEVKFMTANTLQSLNWRSIEGGSGQGDIFFDGVREQVDAIKSIFGEYLKATTAKDKEEIKSYFENAKLTLLREFASVHIPDADRKLFEEWEPFGFSKSAGFFDPQLMFGLPRADGFDIVIGNPPYVRHEDIKDQKPALKEEFGDFFKGTADLYTYFYKKGIQLLKPGGVLAYITPNKFMSTAYGDKTRQLLTKEAYPLVLIDFNEFPVFEATTYPLIALVSRGTAAPDTHFMSLPEKELARGEWTDPGNAIATLGFEQPVSTLHSDGWILEKPEILDLLNKLSRSGIPLGSVVRGAFYRGLLTGLNEAFVIDEETRDRIVSSSPSSKEVVGPWLTGRMVDKWKIALPKHYIINIPSSSNRDWPWSGKGNRDAEVEFAKLFPAIHSHLTKDVNLLEKVKIRADQGKFWWELRACSYLPDFAASRIIYPNMANEPQFCWEEREIYNNDKAFIIPTDDKFLLAVLNSKVSAFWCWRKLPKLMGATMEFRKVFMQHLPIPNATREPKQEITDLANQILDLKETVPDADISTLERQIDERVYTLFDLTPDEIALIERGKK